MNQEIQLFNFNGLQLRALYKNGEPWFVAADVARVLEYRTANDMFRGIDDEEKGYEKVRTPGGLQTMTIVNESGLYTAIVRANAPRAKPFRQWVTQEVLPTIRKTGQYQAPQGQTLEQRSLAVLQELMAKVDEQQAQIEAAKPKVEAFEDFLSAEGSCSVGDAAKILQRAGIDTGPKRLFDYLNDELGWTYRRAGERHIKQTAIERGYLTAKAQSYYDQNEGVRKVATPQIRVTAKGLTRLRELMLPPIEDFAQLES